MKRYRASLCLFLCLIFSSAYPQSPGTVPIDIGYADKLYESANYKAALKEYLRVYYHDRDDKFFSVLEKISICCSEMGMQEKALKYINQYLRSRSLDPSAELESYYYKVRLLLDKDPKLAIAELYQTRQKIIDTDPDRYYYYAAMSHYMDDNYEEAEKQVSLLSYSASLPRNEFIALSERMEKNRNKSHLAPRLMSTIVPGLGQAVNGEVQDGINSALINGSMIWVFVYVARNLSLADAIISVTPYLGRFFIGGMKNAMIASKAKQAREKKMFITEMSALLIKTKMTH